MKKKIIISLFLVFLIQSTSFAFIDAITSSIASARDAAYQAFMKIKIVEQIRILKQNYDEATQYYDYAKELSQHKGGIAGYIVDEVKNNFDEKNKATYSEFLNYMDSHPEDTSYIKKAIVKLDSNIEKKLNMSKKIQEITTQKNKRLEGLTIDASKKMDDTKKDKFERESRLLELEYLSLINQNLANILSQQLEQDQNKVKQQAIEEKNKVEIETLLSKKMKEKKLNDTAHQAKANSNISSTI